MKNVYMESWRAELPCKAHRRGERGKKRRSRDFQEQSMRGCGTSLPRRSNSQGENPAEIGITPLGSASHGGVFCMDAVGGHSSMYNLSMV